MGLFSKKSKEDKDKPAKQVKSDDKKTVKAPAKKAEVKAAPKKEVKKAVSTKVDNKVAKTAYRVLLRPIISEKTTMGASLNKYVFEVAPTANKVEIKQAVSEAYGVMPVSVNIIKKKGKKVRRGRHTGRTKDIKKAIVTLKKGDSIKLYEGI